MRIAVLNKDRCKPKDCNFLCIRLCPMVKTGSETIVVDEESKKPEISEELCSGCGICVKRCPYEAINIINLPEEVGEPVHQYGKNGFRLYNLPSPRKGVVGMIGKNGIGKTTALKILSGEQKPNFGRESIEWDEIIKHFRGHEIQDFLDKISKKQIKISLKPQYVEGLQKIAQGKVKEILKYDENDFNRMLLEKLNIKECLEKKISELSGGELQKVVIFASLSKNADVYLIDEPSSYLDIEERLKLGKIIHEIKDKYVFVVEHDLTVLDYLSEYIYIIFGKPSCYGVISTVKGTRVGINEYLSGYLKAENMRFGEEIKFDVLRARTKKFEIVLTKYPSFEKTYEGFKLTVEEGVLYSGEVLGVLGKNATGKTTFIKVLAGVIKADNYDVGLKSKVSYKPQYIKVSDMLVNKLDLDFSIVKDFRIENLMEKKISELSGGEIQKTAICDCLSKDAEIYLLDEPSAYLDVEERLKLGKFIRNFAEKKEKSVVLIDHDILLVDYSSDRLAIFTGGSGKNGHAHTPLPVRDGMNLFLKEVGVTFRRDPESGRPRANKLGSIKDREQKEKGEYYYLE